MHVHGGLVAASAFVVFLTSMGSLIFSALALGAAVVCAGWGRGRGRWAPGIRAAALILLAVAAAAGAAVGDPDTDELERRGS